MTNPPSPTPTPTADIAERLRYLAARHSDGRPTFMGSMLIEAADTIDRLRSERAELVEALGNMTELMEEFMSFHDSKTKPCGEYGVECPIGMGEWFGQSERAFILNTRAALNRAGK